MKKLLILLLILPLTGCQYQASDSGNITLDFKQEEIKIGSENNPTEQTDDYWVYIRTIDRYSDTDESTAGRSKKGDIVDIRSVNDHPILSEKEKKEWAIIKVSGLTREDIEKYGQDWREQTSVNEETGEITYQSKAYRKYKVDIKGLNLKLGVNSEVKDFSIIKNYITPKTESDIQAYKWGTRWYALTKPFKKLARKIIPPTKAAGENVSTINKTGEDYDTLTLWEDAKDGDLVTETRQETAECYDDDGTLTGSVTIDGSTTNSSYYMKITSIASERHDGTEASGFMLNGAISIADGNTVIEWLEIYGVTATALVYGNYASGTIQNNIIRDSTGSTWGIYTKGTYGIYNNIVYHNLGQWEGQILVTGTTNLYNNTVIGFDIANYFGIRQTSGTVNCYNNVVVNCGTDFSGTFAAGANNYSEDSSANDLSIGTDGLAYDTTTFVNVTAASEDFHLVGGSALIDIGGDYTTTGNIDIDNRDRDTEGDTWDIGADEYVNPGTGKIRIKGGVKIKGGVRINKTE